MYDIECLTSVSSIVYNSSDYEEPCYPFASCPPEHDCSPWDD